MAALNRVRLVRFGVVPGSRLILVAFHRGNDSREVLEDSFGHLRVGDFEAEGLVECDDELQRIDRVQAQAFAEQRQLIADLLWLYLQHQVFHEQLPNLGFESGCGLHHRIPPSIFTMEPVM